MRQWMVHCLVLSLSLPVADVAASEWSHQGSGRFVTLGEYKTDTDFSPVGPALDVDGQEGGFLGLLFEPAWRLESSKGFVFDVRAELRLGGAQLSGGDSISLYGKDLAIRLAPKEGFQGSAGLVERRDATGLVLYQPVVGFGAGWSYETTHYEFWIAQAEENSPEGYGLESDNFGADHWIGGLDLLFERPAQSVGLTVLGSLDRNESLEERRMGIFSVSATRETAVYRSWLHGVIGLGDSEMGTLRDEEQTLLFWGGQVGLEYFRKGARFGLNGLVLSGDDGKDGNDLNGSFQWSGKSQSRTIVLTEDERFRRNHSIAVAMSDPTGVYREVSAGLHVSELAVGYNWDGGVELMTYGAIGQSLEASYTGDHGLLGIETGLSLTWFPSTGLQVFGHGAVVVPGSGGAYVYNGTNLTDEDPLCVVQLGVDASF